MGQDGQEREQIMQSYIGTKILQAEPMTLGDYNIKRGWTIPKNEKPERPGYYLNYPDGYESWSPKEVFEDSYRPFGALTFGLAVDAMKLGLRVARSGWNGKGMFLYFVPAASYPARTGAAKRFFGADAMVPYRAYIAMKTVRGDVVTWAPTVSDALAEDWYILE